MSGGSNVEEVLLLELELQTADLRADPARLANLLAEDFVEIGASGRLWGLAETLEALASEPSSGPVIEIEALGGRVIGDGFVLTHWVSTRGRLRLRRTSLWRRDPGGWRLVHHQGTPLP